MRRYLTQSLVTLPAGVRLELTKPQALARERVLHRAGKANVYVTLAPVQFKAGEVIGYDGDLPKNLSTLVEQTPARRAVADKELPILDSAV